MRKARPAVKKLLLPSMTVEPFCFYNTCAGRREKKGLISFCPVEQRRLQSGPRFISLREYIHQKTSGRRSQAGLQSRNYYYCCCCSKVVDWLSEWVSYFIAITAWKSDIHLCAAQRSTRWATIWASTVYEYRALYIARQLVNGMKYS